MAGGVAHNSKLIYEVINSKLFDRVFVHPASADNGLPIGSALLCHNENCNDNFKLKNVYIGNNIGISDDIKSVLDQWKDHLKYNLSDEASHEAAQLLNKGMVIGWVQGRSEYGPRALGNRSILADPRPKENKNRVNSIIKMREGFRPFAPSVLKEEMENYFEVPNCQFDYRFMSSVLKVKPKWRNTLGAVTHIDGTARLQTVDKLDNPKYWSLIKHFFSLSGVPIVLNMNQSWIRYLTQFNVL